MSNIHIFKLTNYIDNQPLNTKIFGAFNNKEECIKFIEKQTKGKFILDKDLKYKRFDKKRLLQEIEIKPVLSKHYFYIEEAIRVKLNKE